MPDPTPGGRLLQLPADLIARIATGARSLFGGQSRPQSAANLNAAMASMAGAAVNPGSTPRREPWFGPGTPMLPQAPKADVAGRAYDYPSTYNLSTTPRQYEGISFAMLRALADSYDLVRLCIETRKDQMAKLTFSVLPKQAPGAKTRPTPDARCQQIEAFLQYPDRKHTWDAWMRLLLEDQLVIDAASIYVRRNIAGDVYSLDVVDGSTILPRLDVTGRQPDAPDVAYQQILKGVNAVDYTTDELIYAPRNVRPQKVFGFSPVEQLIMTINIAVRREVMKLEYFTEANVPEALVGVPAQWTADQIVRFQTQWDALMADQSQKRRMKFVPGDMRVQFTRNDASLTDAMDEWLARVVCYCFSLPPLPFVKMQNRSTAETSYEQALEEGLQPMMLWFKGIMDRVVQQAFGFADLEFVWDDVDDPDPADQEQRNIALVQVGIKSVDEVRGEMGLPPLGMGNAIYGGPNGVVFIADLVRAQEQGLMTPQPPQAPPDVYGGATAPQPGGAGATPGPRPVAPPHVADVLAGMPAGILSAVGLGPGGAAGRRVDVTTGDAMSTARRVGAAHPQVLATLAIAQAAQRRRGAQGSRK